MTAIYLPMSKTRTFCDGYTTIIRNYCCEIPAQMIYVDNMVFFLNSSGFFKKINRNVTI